VCRGPRSGFGRRKDYKIINDQTSEKLTTKI